MTEASEQNRVEESYQKDWDKLYGSGEEDDPNPKPEEEPQEKEEELEEEPEQEEEPESGSQEESPEEEQESSEEEPSKQAVSKDDEYRQFIENQPTEELKDRARKIVQGLKTADGRASSLHRRLNAREQLIQQLYQQSQQRADPKQKPEQGAPTSARSEKSQAKPRELPDSIKALKEKHPQAAELIEQIAKYHSEATKEEIEEAVEKRLAVVEQSKQRETATAEWDRLEEKSADLFGEYKMTAADVVRSDDFRYWLQKKRIEEPGIVKLYETVNDADTAYLILEKYEKEYQAEMARIQQEEEPANSNSGTDPHKGDQIRQKRQQSLKKSVTPSASRASGPKRGVENLDYEEEWDLLWGKNGKYRQQTRRR